MSCGSVFSILGGGSAGSLQIAGGVPLDATLRYVEDQAGTDSVLKLSTTNIAIGTGTITQNGILTIKGDGGNIISFRNSSNAEVASISNTGQITGGIFSGTFFIVSAGNYIGWNGRTIMESDTAGIVNVSDFATGTIGMVRLGGVESGSPMIKKSGAILQVKLANDSAFTDIESLTIKTDAPSGSTAKKWKLGAYNAGDIIVPSGSASIDIDGTTYKIAVST